MSPYLDAPYDEFDPLLSQDGNRIAYMSTETGSPEIFVAAYPRFAEKIRISQGDDPRSFRWGPDSRTIYYLSDERVIMKAILQEGTSVAKPEPVVFTRDLRPVEFDVFAEEEKFLIYETKRIGDPRGIFDIQVITNFDQRLSNLFESE